MIVTSAFDPHLRLIVEPLPYLSRLEKRPLPQVDLVVIHCTELPDMPMAREYGERVLYEAGTGASGHYYIDRDGSIYQYVDPEYVANHTRGFNPRSIGIELVNTGRYPDWYGSHNQVMTEPYTGSQILFLKKLLLLLKVKCPNLQFIAGHEDLDIATVAASDNPEKFTVALFRRKMRFVFSPEMIR